ncbi:MAG: ribosome small subunit-dependent GTPase A [Bacteroidales bacterium]|nr:ribosome small subunit-dependent GTPase A [Bacteroidales bacterium]MBD5258798.1 ribosome small subunit-dependent GTPase A [Barnesiella sp.]
MEALVIKNTGSWYVVRTDEGAEIDCKIKGNFRLKGIRSTNPIAVGDRVKIIENESGTAFITDILPRKNYIIRRASNLSKESHILASNLDQALLIVTLAHPTTSLTFIDRFLATAEAYRVPAILVINKIDLLEDEEDLELLEAVRYLYDSIGYTVVEISAKRGDGVDQLRSLLAGKTTLLSGNSGVGKTTLINDLIPGLDLRTAAISEVHDTGTHTTTFSEMFQLPGEEGGYLIDTPGVRGFGTIEMDEYEASHFFPEIFKIGADCRFNNCTHTHEPHCAVLEALENGLIAQSRYNSYLSILEDANPDKYRKPY